MTSLCNKRRVATKSWLSQEVARVLGVGVETSGVGGGWQGAGDAPGAAPGHTQSPASIRLS